MSFFITNASETPKGNPTPNVETDGKYIIMDGSRFWIKQMQLKMNMPEEIKTKRIK